tara:strand:+ start:33 stop:719 length:687 start_codon:yes stop_codon:yes gene_type:complete
MKRLLILDLDNTFYTYEHSHSIGLKKTFEYQKIFQSFDEFKNSYEKAKSETQEEIPMSPSKHSKLIYFKKMFSNKLSLNEINKIENIYWTEFIKNGKLQKKAIERLKKEKNSDNVYVLFTNQNLNIQLRKIDEWGIDFFDAIVTSEEAGYEKPMEEFFNFVKTLVNEYYENGYKVFALGDSYINDLDYWINEYDAEAYLVNNDLSEVLFTEGIKNTNLDISIDEIFNY